MATQALTVDGVSGDTSHFGTSTDGTIVGMVSDGSTDTHITPTAADKTLAFSLQGVSDFAVLSGATISSALVAFQISQIGKGTVTATGQLLNSDDEVLVTGNFETGETDPLGVELSAYAPDGGISESLLDGMQIKWVTTNSTQPRLYTITVTITYVAAAVAPMQLTISSGALTMSTGEITI